MEKVTISYNKDIANINRRIDEYFVNDNIKMTEKLYKNRVFLNFNTVEDKINSKVPYYESISNFVTDIIIIYYSKEIIGRKIFNMYEDFSRKEKLLIIDIAYNMFIEEESFIESKNYIYEEVFEYLVENNEMIIDGFVRFRLKEFKDNINNLIEKSIDEYFAEKEYKEFITILQYFVEIQEPKLDTINILIVNDDYELYDNEKNLIEKDYYNEIINDLATDGISNDDLLISTLIVIAPKKIIIHGEKEDMDKETVKIINNVFGNGVKFCYGCEICRLKKSIKKGE